MTNTLVYNGTGLDGGEKSIPCKAVVFYNDAADRERAMRLSAKLIAKFWDDLEFQFTWWKFNFLIDSVIAGLAAEAAAQADVVVFSMVATEDLPAEAKACNELWLDQRNERGGLVVALLGQEAEIKGPPNPVHDYLSHLARRARMEFMSRWEASPPEGTEYLDMMLKRASQVSPVLEEILHRSHPPQHWGINE